jgi:hypothetical protein
VHEKVTEGNSGGNTNLKDTRQKWSLRGGAHLHGLAKSPLVPYKNGSTTILVPQFVFVTLLLLRLPSACAKMNDALLICYEQKIKKFCPHRVFITNRTVTCPDGNITTEDLVHNHS